MYYDDDYFTDGADGYVNYVGDGEIVRQRGLWYAGLLRKYGVPTGRMLDVGAAAGFFLKGMIDAGWTGFGLEPNQKMGHYACTELHVDVRTGTFESLEVGEEFDLISMIQVVAHLTDPRAAFERAVQRTKVNGYWLIETWNHRSLAARLFGRAWHEYSPPRTLHWFSTDSVRNLAGQFGMQIVGSGHPDKSISAEHAKSLLRHTVGSHIAARALLSPLRLVPDRIRIPYPADDLKWYLLQRQS